MFVCVFFVYLPQLFLFLRQTLASKVPRESTLPGKAGDYVFKSVKSIGGSADAKLSYAKYTYCPFEKNNLFLLPAILWCLP